MDKLELQKVVHEAFLSKKYSIKDVGLTPRTVNHWSSEGLISHFRNEKREWHKLSFMEFVEILIYKELRTLGCSIEKVKKVKDAFTDRGLFKISDLNLKASSFAIALIQTLLGDNIFFVVDRDCQYGHFVNALLLSQSIAETGNWPADMYLSGSSLIVVSLRKLFDSVEIKSNRLTDQFTNLVDVLMHLNKTTVSFETDAGKINKLETIQHFNAQISPDFEKANHEITQSFDSYGKVSGVKIKRKYK